MKRFVLLGAASVVLSGCGGPDVTYRGAPDQSSVDLAYVEQGHIPFELQSTILVLSPAAPDKTAQTPAPPAHGGGGGAGAGGGGGGGGDNNQTQAPPSTLTAATYASKAACTATKAKPLTVRDCLNNTTVTASAFPEDDATLYDLAGTKGFGTRTDLSPTYISNSYMLSSVGVAYTDNRTAIFQSAVSAAGTGFALGGPAGAAAGAGVVLASAVAQGEAAAAPVPNAAVCGGDFTVDPQSLNLPLTLTLSDLKKGRYTIKNDKDQDRTDVDMFALSANAVYCWTHLPGNPGWYFQFRFTDSNELNGAIATKDYFATKPGGEAADRRTVPYTACRRGTLFITTGSVLLKAPKDYTNLIGAFSIVVGDSAYLRAMRLPLQGTMTMGSVCGANLAVGTGSGAGSANAASAASQLFAIANQIHGQQTAATSKPGK